MRSRQTWRMEIIMNASIRNGHQQLTATQVLVGAGTPGAESQQPHHILTRVGRCLVAPAVVAVLMLGAHWSVFGSVTENDLQALEAEEHGDEHFPPEYAFRAADFDDPF